MSARATILDLSAFTIGGTSQLATIRDVAYSVTPEHVEGKPIVRMGGSAQPVKRSATVSTPLMTVVSDPTKVTNLNISAFSIGGVDTLANLIGGSFSGSFSLAEGKGVADEWAYPHVVGKDYAATIRIGVPATIAMGIPTAVHAATTASLPMVFTITISSVAVTLPMLIANYRHLFTENDIQVLEVELVGRSPDTGTYPTAPTGTTTLLEKALNAPGTALAFVLTSKAAGGVSYTGNFVYSSFSFDFNQSSIIATQYEFASVGAIAAAST